jgi:uncharacterized membrane protein (UPF0136 family)
MTGAENRLVTHVADDESVRTLADGRFLDDASSGELLIGLTDRRVLCVSETGAFKSLRYEHISSVRSQPRTSWTYRRRSDDGLLAGVLAGLLAIAGTIVGAGLAAGVDRTGVVLATLLGAVAAITFVSTRHVSEASGTDQANRQFIVGSGVLVVVAAAVAAATASDVPLSLFALAAVGSVALATYGPRYLAQVDETGLTRREATLLTITTVDGSSVRLITDADTDLGRLLSRRLSCSDSESSSPVSLPSP